MNFSKTSHLVIGVEPGLDLQYSFSSPNVHYSSTSSFNFSITKSLPLLSKQWKRSREAGGAA